LKKLIYSALALILLSLNVNAQTTWTWTQGSPDDSLWSTLPNWISTAPLLPVPVSSTTGTIVFDTAIPSSTPYTSINDLGARTLNSMIINTTTTGNSLRTTGTFSFQGTTPTLSMNSAQNFAINANGSGSSLINIGASNTLLINGSGSGTLTLVRDTTTSQDNTFSGSGDVTINLTGTLGTSATPNILLGNIGSWTGANLTITRGYVKSFFSSGDFISSSTVVTLGANGTLDFNNSAGAGNDEGGSGNIGGIAGSGTIVTPTGGSIRVVTNTAQTWSGNMTGSGNFTKAGTDTLIFNRAAGQSYTGNTSVTAGTLLVNNTTGSGTGTGTVTVSGGTLGGNGIISGAVTISGTGSTLTPGATTSSIGNLTLNNGLTVTGSGHTFRANIAGPTSGTQHDRVTVTSGNVDIGSGIMTLDISGATGTGYTYGIGVVIVNNTGAGTTTGTFAGLANDAVVSGLPIDPGAGIYGWVIRYDYNSLTDAYSGGNDIALVPVPEPTTILGLGMATIGAIYYRRRKLA
jgi:hypothetical protein